MSSPLSLQVQCIIWKHQGHAKSWFNCMIVVACLLEEDMINDILSLIEVATIVINETTILEIKADDPAIPIKFRVFAFAC